MSDNNRSRLNTIRIVFFVAAGVLLLRALDLQLIDDTYRNRAAATAVDKYTLYPSRGLIYDRNGKLLTNNNPVYDVTVTYNQVDKDMDTLKLCNLLGLRMGEFGKRLNKNFRSGRYNKRKPFVFLSTISARTAAHLQESLYEFPGFFVQTRNVRGYPHRNAAHVLGYIREVNSKEVNSSYRPGDYIGGSGLELEYEKELRGKKGARFVLKDNLGREVSSYKDGAIDTAAVSGKNLLSSIDIDLQMYGEKLMQNKTGSIVAIEPATGEILAFISAPTYNPNLMTINRERGKYYQALLGDSLKPLFNRATMAKYPPGSIFKSIIGLVGIQLGVVDPYRGMGCPGFYKYNNVRVGCRNHPTPSNIGIALKYSCNSYFIDAFRDIIDIESFYSPDVGLDTLDHFLYRFGLGDRLGIDFPQEQKGNVPTTAYFDKIYPKNKGSWKSPTIMSIGIGQGEMEMTGMQMANLAAIVANRGSYYTPHLAKKFLDSDILIDEKYRTPNYVGIDAQNFEPIVEGMVSVVATGTGRRGQVTGVRTAGKTGTVQNPHGEDHSTFIAFAPVDNPKIAISVYVENSGGGSRYAAPISGLMMEMYLNGELSEAQKRKEKAMLEANLNGE